MGARIRYDDGELRRGLNKFERKVELGIRLVVDANGSKGEGYLRTQAPWTDRTGAARTGLHTVTSHGEDRHSIIFAHSVHYGIWLEVKNSGEYEVIMPVVRQTGRELMDDLNHLFRNLR